MAGAPLFDDEDFCDYLIKLLGTDITTLRSCGVLLSPDDFKPLRGMKWGRPRWTFAELILNHFKKHREPIGKLLRAASLEYGRRLSYGDRQISELKDYWTRYHAIRTPSPDAIVEQVVSYKKERLRARAIEELTELQNLGQLTDDKWSEITQKPLVQVAHSFSSSNFFAPGELDARNERRQLALRRNRHPYLFIDPLDSLVQMIGRKHMGLVLAPYKSGKSLLLLWIAIAYVIQRLNVLFFTLEDPKQDVEDRLDAIIGHIPIKRLHEYPRHLSQRLERFRHMIRSQLHIIDGTDGGISVPMIEQAFLEKRAQGFLADAVVVDYDDELVPATRHKEKRFEIADNYRLMRQFGARYDQIMWTAAQTQRETENLKIISGDKAAEDISKLRKVTMAIGVGKGDWGDEGKYLYVAAHKFDKKHVGVNILSDLDRQLIYDRDATLAAQREHEQEEEEI